MLIFFMYCPSVGFFGYRFTAPGVYYYSSGYIDSAKNKLLQGVVRVMPLEESTNKVSVSVGGMEAKLMSGGKYVLHYSNKPWFLVLNKLPS